MAVLRAELRLVGAAAWRAVQRFYTGHDLTFASSIAYFALLSLFPFFLLVFSMVGTLTADPGARREVADYVLRTFPRQFDFVTEQLDVLRQQRYPLGIVGGLLSAWAALGVFGAITTALNYAWDVERQPNYLQHKLVSFLMLLASGGLLLAVMASVGAQGVVGAQWGAVLAHVPWLRALADAGTRGTTTAVGVVVAGVLLYFVPNTRLKLRDVWLGAVLTGALWRLSFHGVSWYGGDPARPSVHGSIATVVSFLVWVYVCAAVLLYGAEFSAAYARLRAAPTAAERVPPRTTREVRSSS
ncbi:MAG: YihY/virulence factor BrkB family protein [Vicinamibacterales bacterium]